MQRLAESEIGNAEPGLFQLIPLQGIVKERPLSWANLVVGTIEVL